MNKLILPAFLVAASVATFAQANQTLCVYDLLGSAGDMVNIAKDYSLAAQSMGAKISPNSRCVRLVRCVDHYS